MPHIALVGDSVIDNQAYVEGGPDVAEQLRRLIPKSWEVSRLAVDGAVIADVLRQLAAIPEAATHLIISAGGNDALHESGVLTAPANSMAEALTLLADVQDRFRRAYAHLLDTAARFKGEIAVCTIYDPRFPDARERKLGSLALSVLNDAVTREAFARNLTLLDLRLTFDDDRDFANPIEPSIQGGMKLARTILRFVSGDTQARVLR
jgi:hypothetical protein